MLFIRQIHMYFLSIEIPRYHYKQEIRYHHRIDLVVLNDDGGRKICSVGLATARLSAERVHPVLCLTSPDHEHCLYHDL